MTTGIRSSADGSKSYIAVGGTDRVTIDADTGKLTSTYSPPTGERSLALATMQKFADEFGSSIATSGYQKLPSGLIIQWGTTASINLATGASTQQSLTFPIAFPNAVLSWSVQLTTQKIAASFFTGTTSNTGTTIGFENVANAGNDGTVSGKWLAIGY